MANHGDNRYSAYELYPASINPISQLYPIALFCGVLHFIYMDPEGMAALQEAMRRRQGLPPSSAGIPGGAQAANANTPANPMASQGMTPQQPAGQGSMPPAPTAENPLAGAQSMLAKAAPDGATMIIKSFADYLKRMPIPGEQQSLVMP